MHKKSKDHKGVSTQQSKPASSIKNRVMVDAKGSYNDGYCGWPVDAHHSA